MKIVGWEHLVDRYSRLEGSGKYTDMLEFSMVEAHIKEAVAKTVWPEGAAEFTIRPESGKKTGQGNGVKLIKAGFVATLQSLGWSLEERAPRSTAAEKSAGKGSRAGAFDCHFSFSDGELQPFVVEWETGNVSSSHRAINRIGLGILKGYVSGGVLIVPSGKLAPFLTDRIGNEPELRPYRTLWEQWNFSQCAYFGIIAIEHDAESPNVARIPKGTDGRSRA